VPDDARTAIRAQAGRFEQGTKDGSPEPRADGSQLVRAGALNNAFRLQYSALLTLQLVGERHYSMNPLCANHEALSWIESYARCDLSLDELLQKVRNALGEGCIHNPNFPLVNLNQVCPYPAVCITARHIQLLLSKRQRGQLTERDMVDWADMVIINDVFYWLPEDQLVSGWVNFLSLGFIPETKSFTIGFRLDLT
jgi:hypothetical protein